MHNAQLTLALGGMKAIEVVWEILNSMPKSLAVVIPCPGVNINVSLFMPGIVMLKERAWVWKSIVVGVAVGAPERESGLMANFLIAALVPLSNMPKLEVGDCGNENEQTR